MDAPFDSQHVVIVIPTYNEKDNILPILQAVLAQGEHMKHARLSILVVDDESPDGTGKLVSVFRRNHPNVHLLTGNKAGLGAAYIRGFRHALRYLSPDIVVQMDADFSHDPTRIPELVGRVVTKHTLVIGSRYVAGGSVPKTWPRRRVYISRGGNWVAKHIAGIRGIADCTGGFRAMSATLLKRINWRSMTARGYGFQINMLYELIALGAVVHEMPIHFYDRTHGASKLQLRDILEFFRLAWRLRREHRPIWSLPQVPPAIPIILGITNIIFLCIMIFLGVVSIRNVALSVFSIITICITIQSIFTLFGMIYAWDEPRRVERNQSPKHFLPPQRSFTAILPALHEEKVIGDTIRAIASIEYPEHLKEILIICRADDTGTIAAATKAINAIGSKNIHLLIPDQRPRNKPDKLNFGLSHANHDVVCIFDAEDAPHKDIYHIINTVMVRDNTDVVQSGVQLVDFESRWFSTLNVLEYFFWFKSVLHLFAEQKVIPLGGNTVFFKKSWLQRVGGWDANCLTEDADIGIKLSTAGAKIRIIYDETHATQEETPPTFMSFIKQRTRWNQGFIQIYKKKEWKKLPSWSQRFLVGYILLWPEIQAALFIYILCSLIMMFTVKIHIVLALISLLPLYILLFHFTVLNVGLREFTKKFNKPYPLSIPFRLAVTFIPFQLALGVAAVRAVYRELRQQHVWEKTEHTNAHRSPLAPKPTLATQT